MTEREAIWELIGAINWIVDNAGAPQEFATAVKHAEDLAESIADKFPLENTE